MKMYEILELPNLYNSIKDTKLPLKTTYKFARLMRRVEEELSFYQTKFSEIVKEYGVTENGQLKISPDGNSIAIIPGKENECNMKIQELRNLEVEISGITFTIEELTGLDISISEMASLMSLIEE